MGRRPSRRPRLPAADDRAAATACWCRGRSAGSPAPTPQGSSAARGTSSHPRDARAPRGHRSRAPRRARLAAASYRSASPTGSGTDRNAITISSEATRARLAFLKVPVRPTACQVERASGYQPAIAKTRTRVRRRLPPPGARATDFSHARLSATAGGWRLRQGPPLLRISAIGLLHHALRLLQRSREMLVVTTENVAGHRVVEVKGQCFGVVVRSRGLGGNVMAGLRSIVGGEIHEYTHLLEETRRQAVDRLAENAAVMGANAVVMMRFDSSEIGQTMSEIVAYGTAAVIEQVTG